MKNALFWTSLLHKNLYSEKKPGSHVFQKPKTERLGDRNLHESENKVCHRINFRATVHKMPD